MKTLQELKGQYEVNTKLTIMITGGDLVRELQKDDGSGDLD
ncbi:hypothetical protein [uncultured Kordia sp.]|nr:hypothetical protein [uncultured Kordia sp.]